MRPHDGVTNAKHGHVSRGKPKLVSYPRAHVWCRTQANFQLLPRGQRPSVLWQVGAHAVAYNAMALEIWPCGVESRGVLMRYRAE